MFQAFVFWVDLVGLVSTIQVPPTAIHGALFGAEIAGLVGRISLSLSRRVWMCVGTCVCVLACAPDEEEKEERGMETSLGRKTFEKH